VTDVAAVTDETELSLTTAPITRTQIVRFAGAAGDFNPMHHDEPFAQAAGQPGVFAMGASCRPRSSRAPWPTGLGART
jgi:acyl dehydratase